MEQPGRLFVLAITFCLVICVEGGDNSTDVYQLANEFKQTFTGLRSPGLVCFATPIEYDGVSFAYQGWLRNKQKFSLQIWRPTANDMSTLISKFVVEATKTESPDQFYHKYRNTPCVRVQKGDHFCFASQVADSAFSYEFNKNSVNLGIEFHNTTADLGDTLKLTILPYPNSYSMGIYIYMGPTDHLQDMGGNDVQCPEVQIPDTPTGSTTTRPTSTYLPPQPGATGPMGAKGEPGAHGATGPIGYNGTNGLDGEKGNRGVPGVAGIQGPKGDPGVKGDKGDAGDKGEQGLRGYKGQPGEDGVKSAPLLTETGFWQDDNLVKYLALWLLCVSVLLVVMFSLVIVALTKKHKCRAPSKISYARGALYNHSSPVATSAYKPQRNEEEEDEHVTQPRNHINPEWMNSLRTEEVTDYDVARVTGISTSPAPKKPAPSRPGTSTSEPHSDYQNIGANSVVRSNSARSQSYGDEMLY